MKSCLYTKGRVDEMKSCQYCRDLPTEELKVMNGTHYIEWVWICKKCLFKLTQDLWICFENFKKRKLLNKIRS